MTPVSGVAFDPPVDVSGASPLPPRERRVFANVVSPGWFETYRIPVQTGREFTSADDQASQPVAVVNEAFVRKFNLGASAVGQSITLPDILMGPRANRPLRIIGVVADSVYINVHASSEPVMYLALEQRTEPFFQHGSGSVDLTIRTAGGPPQQLVKSVAAAIAGINPRLEVTFRPISDQIRDAAAQDRVIAFVAGMFGVLAVLLAGIGLYGVTAYSVARRRAELGIRVVLGAEPAGIVRVVLSRTCRLAMMGVGLGVFFSVSLSTSLRALLYAVSPTDPLTLAGAAIGLLVVAGLAAGVPAFRAAHTDAAELLRD